MSDNGVYFWGTAAVAALLGWLFGWWAVAILAVIFAYNLIRQT